MRVHSHMPRKPKPLTPEEQGQPGVTTGATEDALKASPIDDPEEEKFLVEKLGVSGYLAYLGRRMGVRPPWILSETLLESRISEVYRRCFERNKSPEFINDFVAYRPYLALRAGWLADVVRESLVRRDKPNMVLKALASGFRRAANISVRMRKEIRVGKLQAARLYRRQIYKQLDDSANIADLRGLKAAGATKPIKKWAQNEVKRLVRECPRLRDADEKILVLLCKNHIRKASVAIASRVFSVREYDLERKT